MKLVFFTLLLLWWTNTTQAQNRQVDSLSLVSLYQSTNGAQWNLPWDLNQAMDTWDGVTLDAATGRVLTLELTNKGLTGSLPSQLNLSELYTIILGSNALTGSIPNWRRVPKLIILSLHNNQLSGSIPDFSYLPNLYFLDLSVNNLSGSIPSLGATPRLQTLSLAHNNLGGSIPDFYNLSALEYLLLSQNRLSGTVPDFSNLPLLEYLDLSDNRLTGALPDFTNLARLSGLSIRQNKILDSLPNLSNLPLLTSLDAAENLFIGSLPDFDSLPLLTYLNLRGNRFTGSIPSWRGCPLLEQIIVRQNQLEGRVPVFAAATRLQLLRLEDNSFTFEDLTPGYNFLLAKINGNATTSTLLGFTYRNQDSVGQIQEVTLTSGATYTLDLGVDAGVTSNVYYWYKDGVFIDSVIGSNQYTITNFQAGDAGQYNARITNTTVTNLADPFQNLELYSRPITLKFGTAIAIHKLPVISPINAYPNPASSSVQIELPNDPTGIRLQFINAVGQVLYQETISAQTDKQLDIYAYPAGIYWIRLTNEVGEIWQTSLLKK